jgi:hypothetical protein
MANSRRESHHRNGITDPQGLQQTSATKSAINDQTDERREGRQLSAADEANTSNDGSGVGAIRPWGLL